MAWHDLATISELERLVTGESKGDFKKYLSIDF